MSETPNPSDTTASHEPRDHARAYDTAEVGRARAAIGDTQNAETAVPEAVAGATIGGRYKLLEPIGEGGMGVVWMAEQRSPVKRLVALKLIKAGMDSRAVLTRFEAERQALAMMDHPNIARVFDGGTTDRGHPYFVMELVKGLPLTRYCDQRKMSVRDRLELFAEVCSAVQHAHQKGIIHRDLKPSNVLVTETEGARPLPKVIDFGLAKALGGSSVLTEHTMHTAFGAVAGTPMYMAPEQLGISALDIDTRADIYALGVILYELLAGTTPHEHERLRQAAWDEVRRVIREEEPPRPSLRISQSATLPDLAVTRDTEPARLSKLVAGELDWIVMKSLDKDRHRRYGTASDLAADLQRHLVGDPIVAAPPSAAYRARKFVRKHRGPVIGTIVISTLLVLGLAGTTSQWRKANHNAAIAVANESRAETERAEAELQKSRADQQKDAAETEAYIANLALGQAAMQADRWPEARQRLDACPESKRGWEWKFLRLKAGTVRYTLPAPADFATVSPDGSTICTVSWDTSAVRLWNAADGASIGHPMSINNGLNPGLIFSPDESRVVTLSVSRSAADELLLQQWSTRSADRVGHTINLRSEPRCLQYSPDGRWIATKDQEGNLSIWDANTAQAIDHQTIDTGWAGNLHDLVAPMQHRAGSDDGHFHLDTNTTGHDCLVFRDGQERVVGVAYDSVRPSLGDVKFFPKSHLLLIGSGKEGSMGEFIAERFMVADVTQIDAPCRRLYEDTPQDLELQLIGLAGDAGSGSPDRATSPDGTRLVTSDRENSVHFLDSRTKRELVTIHTPSPVDQIRFTPDGARLVVRFSNGLIEIWDTRDYAERQKDRDARFAEIPAAKQYVAKLLAGDAPTDKLKEMIRSDAGVSIVFKLTALELAGLELSRIDETSQRTFKTMAGSIPLIANLTKEASSIADKRVQDAVLRKIGAMTPQKEADYCFGIAWEAAQPGRGQVVYERALLAARATAAREPQRTSPKSLVVLALYRLGQHAAALTELQALEATHNHDFDRDKGFLAIKAMVLHADSQAVAARAALERAQKLPHVPMGYDDDLTAEAITMVDPASTQPASRPIAQP